MAKSSITVPSRVYAAGTRTVNLPNLTTDDNGVQIIFTRESWALASPDPEVEVITGLVEGTDNGTDWYTLGGPFGYAGGVMTNHRTGLEVLTCGPTISWPERYDGQGNAIPQRPAEV